MNENESLFGKKCCWRVRKKQNWSVLHGSVSFVATVLLMRQNYEAWPNGGREEKMGWIIKRLTVLKVKYLRVRMTDQTDFDHPAHGLFLYLQCETSSDSTICSDGISRILTRSVTTSSANRYWCSVDWGDLLRTPSKGMSFAIVESRSTLSSLVSKMFGSHLESGAL